MRHYGCTCVTLTQPSFPFDWATLCTEFLAPRRSCMCVQKLQATLSTPVLVVLDSGCSSCPVPDHLPSYNFVKDYVSPIMNLDSIIITASLIA